MGSGHEERMRVLARVFDSPLVSTVARREREQQGDCWDCAVEHRKSYVTLGNRRKMIIQCRHVSENGSPVMRSLPFRCPNFQAREKLRVIEGGSDRERPEGANEGANRGATK